MIHMNNVTKVYPNGSTGVENINLHINKGEFVFIVGSSGSGKSTLMKLLLKELDPTEGDIIINKVKTNELNRRQIPYLRRNLGVVFQDFRLLPNKTVYENVAFAMRVIEAPGRIIRRNVTAVLSLVGLGQKGRSYPNQLSGGEQQRTALARAIANNPPILICDEPTGNLDPETAYGIMKLLDDINKRGTTIVMATHARDIVDAMQKRVVTLHKGHIIRDIEKGGYSDEA
ncbi:MAG: cell division ATP-binding protein FtsE [Anaerotignum faecicola]